MEIYIVLKVKRGAPWGSQGLFQAAYIDRSAAECHMCNAEEFDIGHKYYISTECLYTDAEKVRDVYKVTANRYRDTLTWESLVIPWDYEDDYVYVVASGPDCDIVMGTCFEKVEAEAQKQLEVVLTKKEWHARRGIKLE